MANQHSELVETIQQALSNADAGREFAFADAADALDRLEEQLEAEQRKVTWMTEALRLTARIATSANQMPEDGPLGRAHVVGMLDRIENFSSAKLGRWLGWAQAAVVAAGAATLDDMKLINQECSAAVSSPASKPNGGAQ